MSHWALLCNLLMTKRMRWKFKLLLDDTFEEDDANLVLPYSALGNSADKRDFLSVRREYASFGTGRRVFRRWVAESSGSTTGHLGDGYAVVQNVGDGTAVGAPGESGGDGRCVVGDLRGAASIWG